MAISTQIKKHHCSTCNYSTSNWSNFQRHTKQHDPQFQCELCCKRYGSLYALRKHVDTHRQILQYSCKYCERAFKSEAGLRYHIRSHTEDGLKCPYCPKIFYTKSSYTGHMHQHTGQKPYKCDRCSKAFGYSNNLQYHKKHHCQGENKYQCKICNMIFYSAKVKNEHMKGAHMGRTYHCRICGKSFKWRAPLRYHEEHVHKS